MIIRQILHNALIALIYSSSLIASGGKSALTATACTATASQSSSPLAALYKKRFSQGHDAKQWQEIVTTITPLRLVAAKELAHKYTVIAVAWHPAGTHLATGSDDNKARIWDAQSGNPLHILNHQSWVRAVAWNPAGTHLATASDDRTARIWDAQSGTPVHTLDHQRLVNAVAWNPAGTHLATGSDDNKAHIWDAQSGKPLHILDHQRLVNAVAWHPAGTHLATGSYDKKARIWDAQSGKPLHILDHHSLVLAVAWNPAGTHLATGSGDRRARIWDAQSGTPLHTLDHQGWVYAVAWHPAGTHLATGSDDYKACIWDAQSGTPVHILNHQWSVSAVAWHPAGTHLATGSYDRTRIWDAQSGQPLHILNHQGWTVVRWNVEWNPAGTHLATGSNGDKARICDTAHLADPKYKEQYNQFKAGTLPAETLMLIHAFDQFKKQKIGDDPATLKEVADHVRTKGITVAQLAGTLLTLHPIIMHGILQHYGILLERKAKNTDNTPQENYLDSYQTLKAVQESVPGFDGSILNVLGEYIVDKHPQIEK